VGDTWAALAVAAVGVVGTLGAALLTQSRADRTKRLELQSLARQQGEERADGERVRRAELSAARGRELLDLRRACCIALNTAARQYQTAQVNLWHALREGTGVEECLHQLDERRSAHRETYAEAQMILPAAVLAAAGTVSRQLNNGYGTLKKALAGPSPDAAALEAFEPQMRSAWTLLSDMRHTMRRDLGVDDPDP
jgi:TPR repeat protein